MKENVDSNRFTVCPMCYKKKQPKIFNLLIDLAKYKLVKTHPY